MLGEDTPSHLRELEVEWRARRRRVLDGRTTERDGKENRDGQSQDWQGDRGREAVM